MTKEEKQLLLKDLCVRLPHGVMIEITSYDGIKQVSYDMRLDAGLLSDLLHCEDDFKPYLRPMSSMTDKERKYYNALTVFVMEAEVSGYDCDIFDWLNEHHFDYRGLIDKGLALEAPEDMYKEN